MGALKAIAVAAILFAGTVCKADTVASFSSRTALAGNDTVNWLNVAPAGTTIPNNPFSFTSDDDTLSVTNLYASYNRFYFKTFQQSTGPAGGNWGGDFNSGDSVLFNGGGDATTITFSTPVLAVGANIQSDLEGDDFAGDLNAYDVHGNLLGTATFSGYSGGGVGTAPFVGIRGLSGADIASVTFVLTEAPFNATNAFGINQLSLDIPATATPLPRAVFGAPLCLLLPVVAGLRRRYIARQAGSPE